ncbi:MAG: hypothetical protein IT379_32960 [Deltaproteobacteria bacterium]|nr:hypothetical protein [Deltaproteobacteria bacterium]
MLRLIAVSLLPSLLGVAGCGDEDAGTAAPSSDTGSGVTDGGPAPPPDAPPTPTPPTPTPPATPCTDAPYAVPGPYVSGVTTVTIDGATVELWYPADPGAESGQSPEVYDLRNWLPADSRPLVPEDAPTTFSSAAFRDIAPSEAGPFPLVLFSHGLGGYRLQSSFLTAHLATWGFVVAAPEHEGRNMTAILSGGLPRDDAFAQMTATYEWLSAEATRAGGTFEGVVDTVRLAVMGHSAGGGAVQALVDESELPIAGWVGMASIAAPEDDSLPALLMAGTEDDIAAETNVRRGFDGLTTPDKRYVAIAGAGHLAFSDICLIGRERGGVLRIAQDSGIDVPDLVARLAQDGCRPTDLPAERAWPLIDHFVTAHLRMTFGQSSDGLTDSAASCFGALVQSYLHP